jgi:hypothetical protein
VRQPDLQCRLNMDPTGCGLAVTDLPALYARSPAKNAALDPLGASFCFVVM